MGMCSSVGRVLDRQAANAGSIPSLVQQGIFLPESAFSFTLSYGVHIHICVLVNPSSAELFLSWELPCVPGPTPVLNVSYKPQKISPKHQGTVRQLLHDRIRDAYIHPQFVTDVIKPLQLEHIMDQEVRAGQHCLSFSHCAGEEVAFSRAITSFCFA